MFRKKKKVKELNKNGQYVAVTMGTIFGVGVGTAAMMSTYELAEKLVGGKTSKALKTTEEEDDE